MINLINNSKNEKIYHKYWPRKSCFVIIILIGNPNFCFLEFKLNIQLLMIYGNSRKIKKRSN